MLSQSPGATTFPTWDTIPLRVANFTSSDTSQLMFRNGCSWTVVCYVKYTATATKFMTM